MGYKKLISPEFKISTKKYELTDGIEVEYHSSTEKKADWCKVELSTKLKDIVSFDDMETATVELGYEDDFDRLLTGYCRKNIKDGSEEIIIRDRMIMLEKTEIKATFTDCIPQDVIKFILIQSGIDRYRLSETEYPKKAVFISDRKNAIQAIESMNMLWGINNDFFFRDGIFYWGVRPEQDTVYILEENENIMSLKKYGSLFEAETLGVPWIHQGDLIEIRHTKFTGEAKVQKVIIKRNESGYTRMSVFFYGG